MRSLRTILLYWTRRVVERKPGKTHVLIGDTDEAWGLFRNWELGLYP
jgi:hypothetical protein